MDIIGNLQSFFFFKSFIYLGNVQSAKPIFSIIQQSAGFSFPFSSNTITNIYIQQNVQITNYKTNLLISSKSLFSTLSLSVIYHNTESILKLGRKAIFNKYFVIDIKC